MSAPAVATTAPAAGWHPERPKFRPLHVLRTWLFSAIALLVAAWIVPGADVNGFWSALVAAAVIAMLNAILPPLVAALRLPFTLITGFLVVLVLDALMLLAADSITDGDLQRRRVRRRAARRAGGVGGRPRDRDRAPASTTTANTRSASSSGSPGASAASSRTDVPGIIFLEIDGLALPDPAPRDARRQRAQHGALDGRGRLHA